MATSKEQHDARPGAHAIGTTGSRTPPADATHLPTPRDGDVGPPRERDGARADPARPPLDEPTTDD